MEILLSGEHPTLPAAELAALLAVHAPGNHAVEGLVGRADHNGAPQAARRMALAHAWGEAWGQNDEPAVLAGIVRAACGGAGSAKVETEGRRPGPKLPGTAMLRRTLGAALVEAGHSINLDAPDLTVYAWLVGDTVHVGRLVGRINRAAFIDRAGKNRAHFSPVSLHPRTAAAMVHLARLPPGGRIYDPFCGTGSILLEAAVDGYNVLGSDRDAWMVQGSMQTLADDGPEPLSGDAFVADIGDAPGLAGKVDAIVTDLPYGRASGTNGEPLKRLYGRTLEAFRAILPTGARAVVGTADPTLLGSHGFIVREHHEQYVHRSMTRHYLVLERSDK